MNREMRYVAQESIALGAAMDCVARPIGAINGRVGYGNDMITALKIVAAIDAVFVTNGAHENYSPNSVVRPYARA